MNKVWYEIEIECINNSNCDMLPGEKTVVVKVKSKGLAHILYNKLLEVYKPGYFKINIK